MNGPNYSLLIFSSKIDPTTKNQLHHYLRQGIKIFFCTFDETEGLVHDPFLAEAKQKELLYIIEVRYVEEWDNKRVVIEDGNVKDSRLLSFLDQNSVFNKEQYKLEHTTDVGHCIVKAGAGTGKTTTMINRIMFLKHMHPTLDMQSIVMITFTNDAATHMRTKLLTKLKYYYDITKDKIYLEWMEEVGQIFIGTIHAFAREFLVTEGRILGFSRSMQIRSYKYERKKLIEKYIDQYSKQYPEKFERYKQIYHYQLVQSFVEIIEQIQNKSIPSDHIPLVHFGHDPIEFFQFVKYVITHVTKELEQQKQLHETMEISDLISRLSLLRNLPTNQLNMSIHYLFVDEFQDTDESQVAFVSWLVETYKCQLFAVGDIKQSIYRFRGADYTAFEQLKQLLSNSIQQYNEFSLQKNYRSSAKLLNHFNTLFQKWTDVVDIFQFNETDHLLPVQEGNEGDGLVTLHIDRTTLKYLLRRLYNEDVAVLVRSNREVFEMVQRIESLGFFCEAAISGSFYRSLPVREFYLLIRRFTHPHVPKDRYLFHLSSYGQHEVKISTILSSYQPERAFILDLLESRDRMDKWEKTFQTTSAINALQYIIEKIQPHEVYRVRYYQQLRQRFPEGNIEMQQKEAISKMKEYKMNLDRLIYLIKKELGDVQATLYDLEKFLSIKIATDTTENELKLEENVEHRIKVMTVHKAKGLEFDYVLLPITSGALIKQGRSDFILLPDGGTWKMGYSISWGQNEVRNDIYEQNVKAEKEETIGEEARLLYVALTRAKKSVYADGSPQMKRHNVQSWGDLLESGEMLGV